MSRTGTLTGERIRAVRVFWRHLEPEEAKRRRSEIARTLARALVRRAREALENP